ncbi:adenylate/guanylate cyclase domain-containing protein [Ruania halotolerans]|uniref:adenylate/guanylate cyclase domain-containing protein n=1 Tax=Ruania halotolerans TaxID=2897773 RepID=UPI001E52992B|nr:adenylate/guanylate cyclase domain-containing protein [Ruania halotolerans]UFU07520.1 adenylate/guanylate cyclase domain-containing protein [Ruania halotolerans]
MSERSDPDLSTLRRHEERLLGGPGALTVAEFAAAAEVPDHLVRTYWRALGFADVPADERQFTQADVTALRALVDVVTDGGMSLTTAQDLVRALGHSMDRLVLWQVEALVQDASTRYELDDVSARLVVLDRLVELSPLLREQLDYAWRRQLAALLGRIDKDVSQLGNETPDPGQLPLERAVGFIDIVAYTTRAADLDPAALATLVQDFETAARDVVAQTGGRVVKTIGDAVLFVADDLITGVRVATELVTTMDARDLPVRGSVVWGRVLSRSGDIFGPVVNLASRLTDIAGPGTVLMDDVSAALLEGGPGAREFTLETVDRRSVPGLGEVHPVMVSRA